MKYVRSLFLACVGSLAFAGGAAAQSPTVYQKTVQMPGVSCSVTAWDSFTTVRGVYKMNYGGGTSCANNVGPRTLDVVPQVFNIVNGKPLWFSIGGDGLFQGPTPVNPLRLSRTRTAVPSHRYRLLVYGQVTMPNGKTASATACAACQGIQPTLSITPAAGWTYTWPAKTVSVPGAPCSVTLFETSFPYINSTEVMNYGGEMFCSTSFGGQRTLDIAAQVLGHGPSGGFTYYTITGSTLSVGPISSSYLALETARTVYGGHPYRVKVTGTVTKQGKSTTAAVYSLTAGP
jgi:hypothetical protein